MLMRSSLLETSTSYANGTPSGGASAVNPSANQIGLGDRVAAFLRRIYATSRAKCIARDFDVSISTAKLWLSGKRPADAHLERMIDRWGAEFWEAISPRPLEPRNPDLQQLADRLARLEAAGTKAPTIKPPARRKPAAPAMADLVGYRDDLFGGL